MTKSPVLILGARSDIGKAVAHAFAAKGHPIQLAARRAETLQEDTTDIEVRHQVAVTIHEFDALDTGSHAAFIDAWPELPYLALSAVGLMCAQSEN